MSNGNVNIDPELLAKLEAQGFLDPNSASARANPFQLEGRQRDAAMGRAAQMPPEPTPSGPAAPQAPLTPTEQMLSGKLIQAGVPTTDPQAQKAAAPPGAAPQKAQGIFNEPTPSAQAAPGWTPSFGSGKASPGKAISLVSPGVSEEYNMAMGRLEAAPRQVAEAERGAVEAQAAGYDARARQLGEYDREMAIQRRKRSEALDAHMNDYKRLTEEASKQQIDPNKWWNDKDTAGQVLGAIGMLFAGFGGHAKGQNVALDMFNRMTDRSIAAQKENVAQKGKKAEAALNIYHQKLRQFGDEDAADAATRAQMLQQFDLQTKAEALRSGSPVLEAKAEQQSAQIALQLAEIHKGLERFQQGGVVGGPSQQDQKMAFELVKSGKVNPKTGQPLTPNEALQIVMALRGAAPSQFGAGKEGGAGGKAGDKHDIAAAELVESGDRHVEALGVGDRITAGLADIPGLGVLFRGTEGAKKARAQKATNLAPLGYAHAGVGIRNYEDMVHAAEPLLIQPSDTQEVINQKLELRKLGGKAMKQALAAAARDRAGGGGSSEKDDEDF